MSEERSKEMGGAIWVRKSKKGETFLTMSFEPEGRDGPKISLVAFKNKNKSSDKSPDYYITKSRDREERTDDRDGL